MIAQETLDRIRAAIPIADVISKSVELRPLGRSLVGRCPFHETSAEKFHVNSERGFFHCFECGAGGSVIDFVMLANGQTFPEAVRELEGRLGPKGVES